MSNKKHTPALVLFGRDFEEHGGLRALAMEDSFDEEELIDCTNFMDSVTVFLGQELAWKGGRQDEVMEIHDACCELRLTYGEDSWLHDALADYFHAVKGVKPRRKADAQAAALLAACEKRYATIYGKAWLDELRGGVRKFYEDLDRKMGFSPA